MVYTPPLYDSLNRFFSRSYGILNIKEKWVLYFLIKIPQRYLVANYKLKPKKGKKTHTFKVFHQFRQNFLEISLFIYQSKKFVKKEIKANVWKKGKQYCRGKTLQFHLNYIKFLILFPIKYTIIHFSKKSFSALCNLQG